MSKRVSLPISELYAAFDGTMKDCLGGGCSTPCCNEKEVPAQGRGSAKFRTMFDDRDELEYQRSLSPSLEELGVAVEMVDIGHDRMDIRHLVTGCLDTSTGRCKLEGRKPLKCRVYPLMFGVHLPLDTRCPQATAIAQDEHVITSLAQVRELLGYRDSDQWVEAVRARVNGAK